MDKNNKTDHSLMNFIINVVNGATVGILVAVIPNAIFSQIFLSLSGFWSGFKQLYLIVQIIQFLMPVLVGIGVGFKFKLTAIQLLSVGVASYVGSGALVQTSDIWKVTGIGDTINAMLTAGIAVFLVLLIQNKFQALATIAYPVIVGMGAGAVGLVTLPLISKITSFVGKIVYDATKLNPLLMSILIAILFALMILTPISVVAVAFAINLTGLGSGAANLGLVGVVVFATIGSYRAKNDTGTTLALMLGGIKTLMPAFFRKLQMALPIIFVSGIMGAMAQLFNIQGTPGSAGLGFAGLVGPIVAFGYLKNSFIVNLIILILVYAIIPIILSLLAHWLSVSVFKILKYSDYKINLN